MIKHFLLIMLLSATPVIEQRGAIPYGIVQSINPMLVFFLALLGSLLPVPIILLFFNHLYEWLDKIPKFHKIVAILDRKIQKNRAKFDQYKELGLIIFIAIPLPTTGLWTGSMVASFLKLDFKRSLICAFVGGTISATIITLLTIWVPQLFVK